MEGVIVLNDFSNEILLEIYRCLDSSFYMRRRPIFLILISWLQDQL